MFKLSSISDIKILAIIGRRHPAIYNVFSQEPYNRLSAVALNPQPLPPRELGAAIAAEIIHNARFADRFGLDITRAFDDVDKLCSKTGQVTLPPGWPDPPPPPHPPWFIDFQLGFAAQLAVAAVESEGTKLGDALSKAIEKSIAAIESVSSSSL